MAMGSCTAVWRILLTSAASAVCVLTGCSQPGGRPVQSAAPHTQTTVGDSAPSEPPVGRAFAAAAETPAAPGASDEPVEDFLQATTALVVADRPGPLSRPIDLLLDRQPLSRVAALLSILSGLDIMVTPDAVAPERLDGISLNLRMRGVTVAAALDWVARCLDARYRLAPSGTVRLYRDESWIFNEPLVTRSYPSGTYARITRPRAITYDQSGPADGSPLPVLPNVYDFAQECQQTLDLFSHLLRLAQERCDGTLVTFNRSRTELIAVCPEFVHEKVARIAYELRRGSQPDEPPPPPPVPTAQDLAQTLARRISCRFVNEPFDKMMLQLAELADVNIGWRPGPEDRTPVSAHFENLPLTEALNRTLPQGGFSSFDIEPSHGLWLLRADEPVPSKSAPEEFFWDACLVRSYYVRPLLSRYKADELQRMVKTAVTPVLWGEPVPAMAFHQPSGRLVVIHTPAAHEAIREYLLALTRPTLASPAPLAPEQ